MLSGKRVLHLLYEPHRSGISRHVLEVVRALPDLEHTIVLPAALTGVADDAAALGARVRPVPFRSRLLPRATFRALPGVIRDARPDLVHLHALEAGGFGTLAAVLGGARRIVFTPHTIEIRLRPLLPAYMAVLRAASRWHRLWIALSRGQARALERLVPGVAVRCVPNATPALAALPERAAARARLGWPQDAFVAASIGRLSAQKDPLTFVRAAEGQPALLHVVVGDGPLRPEVLAAARGKPWIRVQGQVTRIEDVLASADVVCLVSRWEGLPYTLLEAMTCGVPVVASAIDGNVELVEDGVTGLLVAPGDPAALRAALSRLRADGPLRTRLADTARELVTRAFSPAVVAERLGAVYAESLEGAPCA